MKREKGIQQDLLKMGPRESKVKDKDQRDRDATIKCLKCGKVGHRRANCDQAASSSSSQLSSRNKSSRVNLLTKALGKPCPACKDNLSSE